MKPWHKRIGKSLSPKPLLSKAFDAVEVSAPKVSQALRYHSQAFELRQEDFSETIYRPICVTKDHYRQAYCGLIGAQPEEPLDRLNSQKIPIHTSIIEQCVIHGHIKAPIDIKRNVAVGFEFPHGKLPWGDVYPQPVRWSRRLKGDAIFVPNFTNIFHLLVEYILPSFCAIIRDPVSFQRDIFFVSQAAYPIVEYLAQFLNQKGFRAHVIYTTPLDRIFVDRLILSRARARDSAFNYAYYEEMNETFEFFDKITQDFVVPERVFIKRTKTPRRNVINQQQATEILSEIGVEPVDFTFKNCLQQVAIFRRSKLIIAPHGAALTNLVFSDKDQSLLELFSVNCRPTCFINMASQHNVTYNYLLGSKERGNGHFEINMPDIVNFIKNFSC